MAKKTESVANATNDFVPETTEDDFATGATVNDDIDSDFNLEDEYKPVPLIPNGMYNASIVNIEKDSKNSLIIFTLCLSENGGYMSDGETPVDGVNLDKRVFLPKKGDEAEYTKSGKQTKRQYKINAMREFFSDIKVSANTLREVEEAVANKEWLGITVKVTVGIRAGDGEFAGRFFNEIKKVVSI
jgi:ribosomal protein L28